MCRCTDVGREVGGGWLWWQLVSSMTLPWVGETLGYSLADTLQSDCQLHLMVGNSFILQSFMAMEWILIQVRWWPASSSSGWWFTGIGEGRSQVRWWFDGEDPMDLFAICLCLRCLFAVVLGHVALPVPSGVILCMYSVYG